MNYFKTWLSGVLILGLLAGCSYLMPKPEPEPPPLPPIITDIKPPLKVKPGHFKDFWADLPKARKDGNDADTTTYNVREGDTLETIAEKEMGNPTWARNLAEFNDLSESAKISPGDKIIIPNPIIGVSSQIVVKRKGEKQFGSPEPLDASMKKGDEYKLSFESNVNGHFYVFRQGPKGIEALYPTQVKKSRRNRQTETPKRESKISANQPLLIPTGPKGTPFDEKRNADKVFVFLSLRKIPELEDLKDKIREEDLTDVLHRVKESAVVKEAPNRVIRIADPAEILGFTLNLSG